MKIFYLLLGVALNLNIMFANVQASSFAAITMHNQLISTIELSPIDTISPAIFTDWKNRWNRRSRSYMANNAIDYFTLPINDLSSIIGENPNTVRFYIGMDSTGINGFIPKLMLVGTDGQGNPKISKGGHIYDLSTVCPVSCGDR